MNELLQQRSSNHPAGDRQVQRLLSLFPCALYILPPASQSRVQLICIFFFPICFDFGSTDWQRLKRALLVVHDSLGADGAGGCTHSSRACVVCLESSLKKKKKKKQPLQPVGGDSTCCKMSLCSARLTTCHKHGRLAKTSHRV